MNEDNVEALALGVANPEAALSVAQSAVNAVIRSASNAGTPVRDCQGGGTVAVTNADDDNSFDVSAGDRLSISFASCFDDILNGTADGVVDVELSSFELRTAFASAAGTLTIPSALNVANLAAPNVAVTGNMDFQFTIEQPDQNGADTDTIAISAGSGQQFAVEAAGLTETITGFTSSKTATRSPVDSVLRTDIAFSHSYSSQILGGTFTCESSNLRFASNFIGSAQAANVICRGRNGSAIRITGQRDVSVDPQGNGSFSTIGLLQWEQVVDGFYRKDSGLRLADFSSDLTLRRVPLHTSDVVYDTTRDRLLAAVKATDPAFPNSVVAVSLGSGTITPLLNFGGEPKRARLAADDSLLYVSLDGSPDVQRYDAETLQLIDTITITSSQPFSSEFAVLDLEVSPVDPDTIAVAFQFVGTGNTDIAFFTGNTELGNSYRDAVGNGASNLDIIEYASTGARLFGASTGISSATVLELDANGAVSESTVREGLGTPLKRVGDRIHGVLRAFDEQSLVLVGTYGNSQRTIGIDPGRRRVLQLISGTLNVSDRQTSAPLSSYDLGLANTDGVRDILFAGDAYVLADQELLHVIDADDIAVQNTDTCDLTALMTNEGEAYTRYDCSVTDAVYDPVRDKVYAAVSPSLGQLGNSILVYDTPTGGNAAYVPLSSNPRQIAISADASRLFVIFDGANVIATVDLNTMTVVREQQLTVATGFGPDPLIEPRAAQSISASTIENDAFVVAVGSRTSGDFQSLVAFRDGTRLASEIARADLPSMPSQGIGTLFNEAGQLFLLYGNGADALVHPLVFDASGLSLSSSFQVDDVDVSFGQLDIHQGEIFTASGAVIDTAAQTGALRYTTPLSFSFPGSRAINADVDNGDVFTMVTPNGPPGMGIGRYDYASGTLTAEQLLDSFFFPASLPSKSSLIDVGTTQLGLVRDGFVIVDKSHVQ